MKVRDVFVVMRMDGTRQVYFRVTVHARWSGGRVRGARLRGFGHEQRRDSDWTGGRMLRTEEPGRRPRRPKRRGHEVRWCKKRGLQNTR